MPEERELEEFKKRNLVRERTRVDPASDDERVKIYSRHAATYALIFILVFAVFWMPSLFRKSETDETSENIAASSNTISSQEINERSSKTPPQEELDSFGWNQKPVTTTKYPTLEKIVDYLKKYTLIGFIVSNVDDEKVKHAFEDLSEGVQHIAKPDSADL